MKQENIKIGVYSYGERELSHIIRRRMLQKDHGNNNIYSRKVKHKKLSLYEQ